MSNLSDVQKKASPTMKKQVQDAYHRAVKYLASLDACGPAELQKLKVLLEDIEEGDLSMIDRHTSTLSWMLRTLEVSRELWEAGQLDDIQIRQVLHHRRSLLHLYSVAAENQMTYIYGRLST